MQSPHNPNFILIHMFPSHHGGQCLSALPMGAVDSLKVERKKTSRVAHCGDRVCRGSAHWGNCTAGCCPFLVLSGITGRSPCPSSLTGGWFHCDLVASRGWSIEGQNHSSEPGLHKMHGLHGQPCIHNVAHPALWNPAGFRQERLPTLGICLDTVWKHS